MMTDHQSSSRGHLKPYQASKKQSPMRLKVLPQSVKNSQLGSYKQAVQALSSTKNSMVKNNQSGTPSQQVSHLSKRKSGTMKVRPPKKG